MEVEDLWRDMHFPPEEASIMLIMKMLAMRYLEPAMATKFETFGSFSIILNKIKKFVLNFPVRD